MTLSSAVSRNDYVGTGTLSVYPYTYKIFSNSDLVVTTRDLAGVETTLTLDVDYSVSGAGSSSGGNVTLTAGNLGSGIALTIRRVRTVNQLTDIRNQGAFFPEAHEDAFDHAVMIVQQQQDELSRTIKLPETEAGTPLGTTIPPAAQRAGKVLGFDGSGNPSALTTIPSSSVAISAFGESLVDDVDEEAARATLFADNPTGTTATRPPASNVGRLYFNTDTNAIQRDTGAAWSDVGTHIPSGTKMVFYQATAPVGWTLDSTQNDKALRVVSGSGGVPGGSGPFATHTHTIPGHALTNLEIPESSINVFVDNGVAPGPVPYAVFSTGAFVSGNRLALVTGIIGTSNTGVSPATHNHTGLTGAGAFSYVDVIICVKD